MNKYKLYIVTFLVDLIPFLVLLITMGIGNGDDNLGYYIFGGFFIIAFNFNLFYFFIGNSFFEKNRYLKYISLFGSSFVLFMLGSASLAISMYPFDLKYFSFIDFLKTTLTTYLYFLINIGVLLYFLLKINK